MIAYPFAGTGANMLRYKNFVDYLYQRNYEVDVVGYYDLKVELPPGIHYYQIRKILSFRFLLTFTSLAFHYLYLLKCQTLKEYVRRVGLAATTYTKSKFLIKKKQYESCLVGIHPWAFYMMIPLLKNYIRTILDIGDPLYKNAILKKSSHPSNLLLEKQALEAADYVVTVNEPTIEIMTNEMGIPESKIRFITPAMNIESYCRDEIKFHSLHKPLRIIYSGSLYQGYRDLNEVQPAIELLNDVVLDVFTNTSSNNKSSERVHFHNWIPHNNLLSLYREYDVLLFVDNAYGYQVPSKIFEVLAQNKPILFVYDQRNKYFYNMLNNQKGITFVENKREKIMETLKEIMNKQTIEVCYTFDMSDYSVETVNRKLLALLINLKKSCE